MKRAKHLFFILFFLAYPLIGYSQDSYRDPFASLLLEPLLFEEEVETAEEEKEEVGPPLVTIEGILWGTVKPLAIIDGEVYKAGDKIKDIDAKIFKIEKKAVFIYYGNKIHKVEIK